MMGYFENKREIGMNSSIKQLRNPLASNLKADILYRLDISGKTDEKKLKVVEEIREILRERIKEKKAFFD